MNRGSAKKSLRLRLVLGLSLTLCLLWGSIAAWMFGHMQTELRSMLDDRLIASSKTVASIVQQFQPAQTEAIHLANQSALTSVIGRDGVACEVSLVRSEVEILPLAKTHNSPNFTPLTQTGFGRIEKGGKLWRTYVLEENGIRIAMADRLDVREQLIQSFVYTLVLPFALALVGGLLLTWWICTLGLEPLRRLQTELRQRPPQNATPIQTGRDTKELAPLVDSLNQLLGRMDAAIEHERRWTADAAHELRTPLTAIKTHVQVAQLVLERGQACQQPAQASQALAQASEGIDHLHATLEQLLQLARVETAESGAAPTTAGSGIAEAFELACRQSRQRASKSGLSAQLQTDIGAALAGKKAWSLPVAPALLTCAITNLTDNALRHHQGAAPVHALLDVEPRTAAHDGDAGTPGTPDRWELVVRVQDRGPGMSEQECAQALQRFWRKHTHTPGSGLGLTIVQRIAESAGGRLLLHPCEPGQSTGLMAELRLPLQPLPAG
ncbi:MAG: two-component sensor histidine kinase [Acidovorax sp.]|jgi:signal transduction histidine kinase|nr:two-component sensor histidine kinase [Acidovorax sp.]